MEEVVTQEIAAPEEQSSSLNQEEVQLLFDDGDKEVILPSDEPKYDIPEKFKGKSAEDIAKAYQELEKKLGESKKEVQNEEPTKADSALTEEEFNSYVESYRQNNGLTEEDYANLEAKGFSREQVDERIDYVNYKQDKAIKQVVDPLGGVEKFKAVSDWARENIPEQERLEINQELKGATPKVQQLILKDLFNRYDADNKEDNFMIHSSTSQQPSRRGYANESEFFADIDKPEYKKDRNYAKAVEAKLAKTDTTGWSF